MTVPRMKVAVIVILFLTAWPVSLSAQARDDRAFLQSIIDACPPRSTCQLPPGSFEISASIEVARSIQIKGMGRGPRNAGGRKEDRTPPNQQVTEIRVRPGARVPAFTIRGTDRNISVAIRDIVFTGGGILVGGPKDPCRGIEDPDAVKANLTLKDVSIANSVLDAIRFEGGSLVLQHIDVENDASTDVEGNGLYIANATGNVVVNDAEFVGRERWGIYICNLEGTGLIAMNNVSVRQNARGGVAIVGEGTPPTFRTVCMQNTGAVFNRRFGVMLFNVARTLLFNVTAGFTFGDDPGDVFGDGIAVSSPHELFFWNTTTVLNNRAGVSAFGPPTGTTHVHLVGDFSALSNGINLATDGAAHFHPHENNATTISGLCGLPTPITAPSINPHCEEDVINEVECQEFPVSLQPPDPAN